jgi:hypothetical protein
MAISPVTKHVLSLIDNIDEVIILQDIHQTLPKKSVKQKQQAAILHKSTIVLLVACWEAFIEDLSDYALKNIIEHSPDHSKIPQNVLERVASKNSGINAWKLAGNGWKTALKDNYTELIATTTGKLNTPKTAQIDELFLKSIGLKDLSSNWHWKGRSNEQCKLALDELITLRGAIAHRLSAGRSVTKANALEAKALVSRIAVKSSNAVCRHVEKMTGHKPWTFVRYKATK